MAETSKYNLVMITLPNHKQCLIWEKDIPAQEDWDNLVAGFKELDALKINAFKKKYSWSASSLPDLHDPKVFECYKEARDKRIRKYRRHHANISTG